jgi:hypothetical protein
MPSKSRSRHAVHVHRRETLGRSIKLHKTAAVLVRGRNHDAIQDPFSMIAITDQAPHQNRAPMLRYAIEGEQQIAREGEADRVSISSKCQRLLKYRVWRTL